MIISIKHIELLLEGHITETTLVDGKYMIDDAYVKYCLTYLELSKRDLNHIQKYYGCMMHDFVLYSDEDSMALRFRGNFTFLGKMYTYFGGLGVGSDPIVESVSPVNEPSKHMACYSEPEQKYLESTSKYFFKQIKIK